MIIGSADDGTVLRFDARELDGRFHAHDARIRALAVSPDGTRIFTAGDDRVVRAFRADAGPDPLILELGHPVRALAFAPDGKALAAATERKLHTLEASGFEPIEVVDLPPVDERLAVSSSWARLATTEGNDVVVLDSEAGEKLHLRGHDGPVSAVAFAGDVLVSASKDETVRTWAKGALTPSAAFEGGGKKMTSVAGSEAGGTIAAAGGGRITVWRGKRQPIHRIDVDGSVRALAINADGTLLAAGNGGTLEVWSTLRFREVLKVDGHAAPITAVTFGAGEIVTASEDGAVRSWPLGPIEARRSTLLRKLEKRFGVRLEGTKVAPRL
jgi:WD40 repeat protein